MLQSFALQNSSLNFKSTKHEYVTHFTNVKGTLIHENEFKLKNLRINLRIFEVCFQHLLKTVGRKVRLLMAHRIHLNQYANAIRFR